MTNQSKDVKRAVVTGASSGIGAASARALVAAGWQVVGLARREDRLKELSDELAGAFSYRVCDVTDEASTQAAVEGILGAGPVKALVNCAGGAIGKDPVAASNLDDWRSMYELNVLGTLRITQKLLPALKEAEGTVLVISSTAGIEPYEGGGGYCAAKAAERVMARILRLELIGQPVRVIDIAPGMVHTDEFAVKRFGGDQAKAQAVYAGVPDPLTAEDVAGCVQWALDQPDTVDIDQIVVRPRAEGSYTKVYRQGS
ncbi:short-chain dehydrogenase [Bifidobacterium actinocoloniiforme DSM 22766]|uniref:Short-chain dehydrogenase n=1 Tax=Bifidobacterium actinocoloniiforme DSM 22766 TaxID=1437605 RepID=A0A086YWB9_9BIFI|nr:SDR family oxidoreductase [Bifidobacterium actinocoloniiforme]AKV55776.1 oxidoreductase [Bifidobacterium actinocoloniiforme DSM 22766]KFI38569.1 short-chain dehydrogenase [Bifidobacterium actinocoloniiforme DSM 22766]